MHIFLDIETLPGPNPPALESIKPPSNYRDPVKILQYQQEKQEEEWRKQALDSMRGEILCIGFQVGEDDEPRSFTSGLGEVGDEADVLREFENAVIEECGRDRPEWVAFNGHGFDLPWIWRKSIKYGLEFLPGMINFDRYRGNIIDPMRLWCPHDYRGYVKLGDLAEFLGIGAKTQGFDGSMVFDAWREGRLEEIAAYCRDDVQLLAAVHRALSQYLS
ncbi:ribonuclease H-like domain-containing protein [Desulfonatronum thiodismutans]|uniref:ribonuclease H-like domain-containing protein n=1 Tax=Desulfonatronum thiodismutans TaxID=159290 RepID=UPI0004ABE9EC|nr:ribonuclease H-like domain-containing protein [Desulfonatronum thiodismutans]